MRRRTSAVFAAFSHWQAVPAGRYPGRRGGLPDPAGYRRSDNTASAPFWHRTPARSAQRPLVFHMKIQMHHLALRPFAPRPHWRRIAGHLLKGKRPAAGRLKRSPARRRFLPRPAQQRPIKLCQALGIRTVQHDAGKFCSHLPLFPFCTRQGPIRPAPSARHFTRFIAAQPGIREAHAWHPLVRLPPRSRNSQGNPSTYRAGAAALQW